MWKKDFSLWINKHKIETALTWFVLGYAVVAPIFYIVFAGKDAFLNAGKSQQDIPKQSSSGSSGKQDFEPQVMKAPQEDGLLALLAIEISPKILSLWKPTKILRKQRSLTSHLKMES